MQWSLTVRATDEEDNFFEKSFEIKVEDRFEFGEDPDKNAPEITSLSTSSIPSDIQVGDLVATINATDPNHEIDEIDFSIAGPKIARKLFRIEGNQIFLDKKLNKKLLRRKRINLRISAVDPEFDRDSYKATLRIINPSSLKTKTLESKEIRILK